MMRFKADENMPQEVAALLVHAKHDAVRVDEQGLAGVADAGLAAVCKIEQRAIVSLDTDFMDIRRFPPLDYAGIIVLRPRRQSVPRLVKLTERFLLLLDTQRLAGRLWIVDERRIRIRPEE